MPVATLDPNCLSGADVGRWEDQGGGICISLSRSRSYRLRAAVAGTRCTVRLSIFLILLYSSRFQCETWAWANYACRQAVRAKLS